MKYCGRVLSITTLMCVFVHVYVCIRVCVCVCTYVCVRMCVCICMCVCVCVIEVCCVYVSGTLSQICYKTLIVEVLLFIDVKWPAELINSAVVVETGIRN